MRVDIRDALVAALAGTEPLSAGSETNHGAFKRLFLSLTANGQPRTKHDPDSASHGPETIEEKPGNSDPAASVEVEAGADESAHKGAQATSAPQSTGGAVSIPKSEPVAASDSPENTESLSDSNDGLSQPATGLHKTVSSNEAPVWSADTALPVPDGRTAAKTLRDTIASSGALTAPGKPVDPARRFLDRFTYSQVLSSQSPGMIESRSAIGIPMAPKAGSADTAVLRMRQDPHVDPNFLRPREVSATQPAAVASDTRPTEQALTRVEPNVGAENHTLGRAVPPSTEVVRSPGFQREHSPAAFSQVAGPAPAPLHRPDTARFQTVARNLGGQDPDRSTALSDPAPIGDRQVAPAQGGEGSRVPEGNQPSPEPATLGRADTSGQTQMPTCTTPAGIPIKAMAITKDDSGLSASPIRSGASTESEPTPSHHPSDTAEVQTPKSGTSGTRDAAHINAPLTAAIPAQGEMPGPDMKPSDGGPAEITGIEAPRAAPETGTARPVDLTPAPAQAKAAQVVQQLTPAMKVFPDGIAEVTLSPHELGHVRMAMRIEGDAIVVHMTADRPETLDLLQRHTGQLGAALRDAGFADVNFAFSQGGRQPPNALSGQAVATPDAATEDVETTRTTLSTLRGSGERLDLRL